MTRHKFPQQYTDEQILSVFENNNDVYSGLTALQVSKAIGCCKDTAVTRLKSLVPVYLKSAKIGCSIVYWKEQ